MKFDYYIVGSEILSYEELKARIEEDGETFAEQYIDFLLEQKAIEKKERTC